MRKFIFAFLGILLSTILVFSSSAVAVTKSGIYANEDYIYEVTSDNTVTIHYYIGNESMVTVPATIDGLPVKVVGERAFYASKCRILIISHGIETLMDEAFFYCPELMEVSLPPSLKTVGFGVFRDCSKLKTVRFFGNSDKAMGGYMFYGCTALSDAVLPESATCIPVGMFGYCQSLNEITLPDSVQIIDSYAFYGSGLVWVKLPVSLDCINEKAFAQSTRLEIIVPSYSESGYNYIAEDAFEGCIAKNPSDYEDFIVPTDPGEVPNVSEPVPPWNPPTKPVEPGVDATIDEEEPTVVTDPTEPLPPESTFTQDGYYMGSSEGFVDSENEHISSAGDMVAKRKQELLSLAWNVRMLGDSNIDFTVNIKDATNVQKYVAQLIDEDDPNFDYKNSDADTDGQVTVRDATRIQKLVAGLVSTL